MLSFSGGKFDRSPSHFIWLDVSHKKRFSFSFSFFNILDPPLISQLDFSNCKEIKKTFSLQRRKK